MSDDRGEIRRRQIESFIDLNKDLIAKEAFADAFINILREVNRVLPGPSGATELARLFEMLDRGAKFTFGDLAHAALERIRPPHESPIDDNEYGQREEALLQVALAGLSFLIENAATDSVAGTRRTKRRQELLLAIRHYDEAHTIYLARQRGRRLTTKTPSTRLSSP